MGTGKSERNLVNGNVRSLTRSRRPEDNYRFRTKDRFHIMAPPTAARLPEPLEPDPTVVRSGQRSATQPYHGPKT